ncbi:MAG: TRAP transporter substrate-binding protein DctP [Deltaproteobacteria bacterium]|nr:TRAP transporter substrate-binding protein DctP [Deltaproteobacteria bacterium]
MKMRTVSTAWIIICAFTLVLFVLVGQAPAKTYNWKLQSVWRTPATQDGLKLFAENVKKATNGQVNIKVYAANELVKIRGTFRAVQSGAVEMACSAGPYNARMVPEGNVEFGLPFSWTTWDQAWEAWNKYGLKEKIREAYAEKGIRLITIQPAAEYAIMTTKPVRSAQDLKGLKLRSVGMMARVFQALGASPTSIPGAEQYVALQRGTVDGTIYPVFVLDAYKLKEVIKYVILPSVNLPTTEIFMNLDLWKSLPPDIQNAIEKASTQHQAYMDKRYLREGYIAVGSFVMRGSGEVIVLPEAEVRKIRKIAFAQWDRLGSKSPRLRELVDAVKRFMADKGLGTD